MNAPQVDPRNSVPARQGRPVDREKRLRIIEAASEKFMSDGFGSTSIESVAGLAGVSKVTIYNNFGSKQCLFSAVIRSECDKLRSQIALSDRAGTSLEQRLKLVGRDIIDFLGEPRMVQFEQRLAAETKDYPQLGMVFLGAGPLRLLSQLTEIFEHLDQTVRLSVPDPSLAAEQFVGVCKGVGDIKTRFGVPEPADVRESRIEAAVALFLKAYS